MKKQIVTFMLASALFAGLAYPAGTPVHADQGKPGTQGEWPTAAGPRPCALTLPDGGTPYQSIFWDAGGATFVPWGADGGSGSNSNRAYVVICNSKQNATSTTLVKCRSDGTAPVMAISNAGDVLAVGECIVYSSPRGAVQRSQCIADTATAYFTSFECL